MSLNMESVITADKYYRFKTQMVEILKCNTTETSPETFHVPKLTLNYT